MPTEAPSSIEMVPSLPTAKHALAKLSATSSSPLLEIIATRFNPASSSMGVAMVSKNSVTTLLASLRPLANAIGSYPETTSLWPCWRIEAAMIDVVVVPSPACSFTVRQHCFMISAPIFSTGSGRVISRATVTPSFVTNIPAIL